MRKKAPKMIAYNPAFSSHGYDNIRWVENVSDGLRRVGFADEIVSLRHKGWFTEDDGLDGEVYRGVVYQLPTPRGASELYVYGYDDPCNEDAALLCFDDVEVTKEDAAHAADRFAEIFAEHERDYDRAWQAGRHAEELDERIKDMRSEALAICAEMRAAKGVQAPASCKALRAKVFTLYHAIQQARKERDELKDTYGKQDGFADA